MKATLVGAAWLGGICLAYFGLDSPVAVALAAVGAAFVTKLRLGTAWAIVACTLLIGGALRFAASEDSVSLPQEEANVEFTAVVLDDPRSAGPRTEVPVEIQEASQTEWESNEILLAAPAFFEFEYGDLLLARGTISPLDTGNRFDEHLLASGVSGRLSYPERLEVLESDHGAWWREPLVDLRQWASERMDSVLPEPASGLARGMVLGERADIDRELRRDLSDAGISHLIAISGQNIVLLAGLITAIVVPLFGRRWAAMTAMTAVITYAALLGAPSAILRATLMASLFVLAPVFGRQAGGVGILMVAGFVLTAIDPQIVRDVSFQLSFAAVGGLIVLAGPLAGLVTSFLQARGIPAPVVLIEVIAVTGAAWLATLPVTAISFDRLSLVGFGTNPLVAAAFAPMLVSSLLTIPASYLPEAAQLVLSWPAWVLFEYFRAVGETAADLPSASVAVSGFSSAHAVFVYAALLVTGWLVATRRTWTDVERPLVLRPGPAVFVPALLLSNLLLWPGALTADDDELRISFLDVGQGDAILIETPDDKRILVDGGPDPARLIRELDDELGFGSRHLDLVLLSHLHADHATGLIAVLERYEVSTLAWNDVDDGSALDVEWLAAAHDSHAELVVLEAGDELTLDDVRLQVLWPKAENRRLLAEDDASLVLRVSYGETDVLLTGDIGMPTEVALLASAVELEAEVLKVAHHGSAGSSLQEFLLAVDPDFAIVQSGASNPFGHPHPDVLAKLRATAQTVLRNDVDGTITLVSDGRTVWQD